MMWIIIVTFGGIFGAILCIFIFAWFMDEMSKASGENNQNTNTKTSESVPTTQTQEATKINQIEIATAPIRSEQEENYENGLLFEQYALSHFSNFVIEDVTSDYHNKARGIFVESSMNPDFRIRHEPTKTVFAIECKYRKSTYWDNEKRQHFLKWSYPEQLNRYREYQRKNNIPVCIMIGLGNNPSKPSDIFLIPLNSMHSHILTQTRLYQFRINPIKQFSWYDIKPAIEK